ncbi:MAG: helix-turn-helix domain-containing protein [Clostridiales bacterium]|nr:helix-turn-helix domain-containing protein [Clostridiales bacterium]
MKFGEKVRIERTNKKMTQKELGEQLGVTTRTITGYEKEGLYPRKREIYYRLAEIFGTDKMYFIGEEEDFISDASEKYGSRGRVQAENLVRQISGLFAGGSLDEEDKDAVMRSIMDAYWESKNENSEKYSRKDKDGDNK